MATFLPLFAVPNATVGLFGFPNEHSVQANILLETKGWIFADEKPSQLGSWINLKPRHNEATSFGFPNKLQNQQ